MLATEETLKDLSDKSPTAAAGADGGSNATTTTTISSRIHGYNGSTWDRIRAGITTVVSSFVGFLNTVTYAVYSATPTTRTDGQGGPLQTEADGSLRTSLATGLAGEDLTNDVMKVEARYSYTPITTATTTTVKASAGFLHKIIFNKRVANGVTTLYDNTTNSGTKIATITEGASILSDPPNAVEYNCTFTTGLTIVTGAAEDITVIWR